jgi:hypothetical protein
MRVECDGLFLEKRATQIWGRELLLGEPFSAGDGLGLLIE